MITMVNLRKTKKGLERLRQNIGASAMRNGIKIVEVQNENIAISCAMRGRYEDSKIVQHIELNGEEHSNSITTVAKDSLVAIMKGSYD